MHSDDQILYHLFERFRHPQVTGIVVVASVPAEPFLQDGHVEWNRKRPDLVPFSLETDEKRWQYRSHVSLPYRIQCQLEVGQPGAGMRLLGLIERAVLPLFAQVPVGRMGKLDEIADAIAFLASPLAGYITGINLRIDGGLSPSL